MNECAELELILWVRTRWGSLYHCWRRLIQIRDVSVYISCHFSLLLLFSV